MAENPFTPLRLALHGLCLIAANSIGFINIPYLRGRPELTHSQIAANLLASQSPVYLVVNLMYLVGIGLAIYPPAASYDVFFAALIGVGFNIHREISRVGLVAAMDESG